MKNHNYQIKKIKKYARLREKNIIAIREFSDLLSYLDFKDRNIFQSLFLGFTAESIGADRVVLYFYNKDEETLYPGLIKVYKNKKLIPYDYYSELMDVAIKKGTDVCGKALASRSPQYLNKLDKKIYKGIVDKKINMKINSIISIPIIIQDNIYGIIEAANNKKNKALDEFDYYVISIITNLAISKMEQAQLSNWANTDNLTQLYNFHYYQIYLEQELNHIKRSIKYMSIVIIDIDNFKTINDTYGHSAGNMVLKSISRIIMESVMEDTDIPIRYGGDEFLLLLPERRIDKAKKISENILKAVRNNKFNIKNKCIEVTVSIGISLIKLSAKINKDEFIKKADKALYQSKNTGKNKISIG